MRYNYDSRGGKRIHSCLPPPLLSPLTGIGTGNGNGNDDDELILTHPDFSSIAFIAETLNPTMPFTCNIIKTRRPISTECVSDVT